MPLPSERQWPRHHGTFFACYAATIGLHACWSVHCRAETSDRLMTIVKKAVAAIGEAQRQQVCLRVLLAPACAGLLSAGSQRRFSMSVNHSHHKCLIWHLKKSPSLEEIVTTGKFCSIFPKEGFGFDFKFKWAAQSHSSQKNSNLIYT